MRDGVQLTINGTTESYSVIWRGVRETHEPLMPPVLRRTINGRLMRLWSRRTEKVAITLSADGDRAYPPELESARPGASVHVLSSIWKTCPIDAEPRWSVAQDENGVPFRTEVLDARGQPMLRYRPIVLCVLVDWDTSGEATGRQTGWSMRLEEI